MGTPVAQTWEKHPREKKYCRETSPEDFLCFVEEAGHTARGRSNITASLEAAAGRRLGGMDSAEGMNLPGCELTNVPASIRNLSKAK